MQSTAPKNDMNNISNTELNESNFKGLYHSNIQYMPLKIQQISLEDSIDGPFITEPKTNTSLNKISSNMFINESIKSNSKSILKRVRKSRISKNSQYELPLIEEIKEVKPIRNSMILPWNMEVYDLSYRK